MRSPDRVTHDLCTHAILLAGKLTVAVCCKPFQFWFMIEQFVHMGCIFIFFFYFSSSFLESFFCDVDLPVPCPSIDQLCKNSKANSITPHPSYADRRHSLLSRNKKWFSLYHYNKNCLYPAGWRI